MNKKIAKHIKNQDYVKVYIADEDKSITNFNGLIFEQSNKFILMSNTHDFYPEGLVVLRKSDVTEIRHSDNEKFYQKILEGEKIIPLIIDRCKSIPFSLDSFPKMFAQLQKLNLPLIVECNYNGDDRFNIGPVEEVLDKKVRIKYFNSRGEFDLKPVTLKYKEITVIRFDDPYANTFFKYAFQIE